MCFLCASTVLVGIYISEHFIMIQLFYSIYWITMSLNQSLSDKTPQVGSGKTTYIFMILIKICDTNYYFYLHSVRGRAQQQVKSSK